MEELRIWMALFGGIAVAQSVFLGTYLIFRKRQQLASPFFLGLLLIGLSLRIGKSLFYYVFPDYSEVGLVLGAFGLLLIGPSLWGFVRSSQGKKLDWAHYLHFAFPFGFLSIGLFLPRAQVIYTFYLGTHLLILYLLGSYLWARKEVWETKPRSFTWIFSTVALIWAILEYQSLSASMWGYTIGSALYCILLYMVNFYILSQQDLFKFKKPKSPTDKVDISSDLVDSVRLLFTESKIYRKKGLTLAQVAQELGKPVYQISQVIKNHHGLRFTEFVNKHRVEEVKARLQDPEDLLKIEALATEVGFSSTSSLYQAFKRETQMTPQHYRKKHLRPVEE